MSNIPKHALSAFRQHHPYLSEEEVLEKAEKYYETLNYVLPRIKEFGVSKVALTQYIKKHPEQSNEDIVNFYVDRYRNKDSETIRDKCKRFGVSDVTVCNYRRKYNISLDEAIKLALERKAEREERYKLRLEKWEY